MRLPSKTNGFTLIELIVVIIMASIFAAMMYQFVYTAGVRSSETIFVVGKSLKLHDVMENITLDYSRNFASDLNSLQTRIGATEGSSQNNSYGVYKVIHNRFITFVANSEQTAAPGDPENGMFLKVTIESTSSREKITALYYRQ